MLPQRSFAVVKGECVAILQSIILKKELKQYIYIMTLPTSRDFLTAISYGDVNVLAVSSLNHVDAFSSVCILLSRFQG